MTASIRVRFATVLALAVLPSVGCSGKTADTKGSADRTDKGKGSDTRGAKPDFSIGSKQLEEEYARDRAAAETKYKDKVLELTGVVKIVGHHINKAPYLSLEGANKDLLGIMCFTQDRHPWRKATPGQTVKLRGKWPRQTSTTALVECVLIEVSGPRAPSLTAEALAKEYAADPRAASEKYEGGYLILAGEIETVTPDEQNAVSVSFKTAGTPRVLCKFTAFDGEETDRLKPGQKVKILGQYALNFNKDDARLFFCVLYEEPG
jgi:hypothetical protein